MAFLPCGSLHDYLEQIIDEIVSNNNCRNMVSHLDQRGCILQFQKILFSAQGILPVWIFMWFVSVLDCLNCFSHTVHLNGFSPVAKIIKNRILKIFRCIKIKLQTNLYEFFDDQSECLIDETAFHRHYTEMAFQYSVVSCFYLELSTQELPLFLCI